MTLSKNILKITNKAKLQTNLKFNTSKNRKTNAFQIQDPKNAA